MAKLVTYGDKSLRRFAPLAHGHPLVSGSPETHGICPACGAVFRVGDEITLIALGPGADAVEQERARDGRAYNAVAVPVHWACATGER